MIMSVSRKKRLAGIYLLAFGLDSRSHLRRGDVVQRPRESGEGGTIVRLSGRVERPQKLDDAVLLLTR